MSDSHPYHVVTSWRIQGTPADIFEILDDPANLPRWWPAVFLSVQPAASSAGLAFDLHTQAWLPSPLRWQMRVVERTPPRRLVLEASGDLIGRGVWLLTADSPWVDVTFDWQVAPGRPGHRQWSWLLRPLFAVNHRWAMARGEESLERELAFRQAAPETAVAIPPPPRPSNVTLVPLVAITLGAFLVVLAVLYFVSTWLLGA